jgi:hypothetical protein
MMVFVFVSCCSLRKITFLLGNMLFVVRDNDQLSF